VKAHPQNAPSIPLPRATALSCTASYGAGGLGQHLSHFVELIRTEGNLSAYYCAKARFGDEGTVGRAMSQRLALFLSRWTPVRLSPSRNVHLSADLFDRGVASILLPPVDRLIGFNGQVLRTFRRARALGCQSLELVAATGHVDHVARQHESACARYPLESDWLNEAQRRKTVNEYAAADVIHVGSQYSHDSFVSSGVPGQKLRRVSYAVDERFKPGQKTQDGVLRIVYTGSITVTKGIPVLIEAMEKLRDRKIELTLIGGCATRRFRIWLDRAMARDPRIKRVDGDPLPYLHNADAYVHPSFQDGFGYAPMEALACGVPVIVTEDTGMKEHVREGIHGYVVPTGDVDALVQRMEHLAKHPLRLTP